MALSTRRRRGRLYEQESDLPEIILILVGKTGTGKSATGNTILMKTEDLFVAKQSPKSVTERTTYKTGRLGNRKVRVIDTPGLFDANLPKNYQKKLLEKEILKSITLCIPGPNAFLYVVRIDRITAEDLESTQKILKLFTSEIYKYMIVVLTGLDQLDEGQTFDEFYEDMPVQFREFLDECNGRILKVNNKWDMESKREFRIELEGMLLSMGLDFYKNETLEEATKIFYKRVQQIENANKVEYEEAKKRALDEIESEGETFKLLAISILASIASVVELYLIYLAAPIAYGAAKVAIYSTVASCSIM